MTISFVTGTIDWDEYYEYMRSVFGLSGDKKRTIPAWPGKFAALNDLIQRIRDGKITYVYDEKYDRFTMVPGLNARTLPHRGWSITYAPINSIIDLGPTSMLLEIGYTSSTVRMRIL